MSRTQPTSQDVMPRICRHYPNCRYGDRCHFIHEKPEMHDLSSGPNSPNSLRIDQLLTKEYNTVQSERDGDRVSYNFRPGDIRRGGLWGQPRVFPGSSSPTGYTPTASEEVSLPTVKSSSRQLDLYASRRLVIEPPTKRKPISRQIESSTQQLAKNVKEAASMVPIPHAKRKRAATKPVESPQPVKRAKPNRDVHLQKKKERSKVTAVRPPPKIKVEKRKRSQDDKTKWQQRATRYGKALKRQRQENRVLLNDNRIMAKQNVALIRELVEVWWDEQLVDLAIALDVDLADLDDKTF